MALEPEELKQRARRETGLDAFGDAPMDEGLAILCTALHDEARLTPEGNAAVEKSIVATLAQRLRVEDWLTRHPDLLERDIAPALLLIGMPRSGTTAFSQHLFEDPRARSILRWELDALVPAPGDPASDADPRIEAARQAFAARDAAMPWRRTILPVAFDDPSEHGVLLGLTFLNLQLPTLYRVPSYEAWLLAADMTPAYAYLARILRLLQAQRPAEYWNLKNPPDLFALEAIEAALPGTRYIWAHRDPLDSISSVCSLTATFREKQDKAFLVDKGEIGRSQLAFQALGADRAMVARDAIGEHRFIDVYQADLSRDMVSTLSALYARLDMPFTDTFRASLEERAAKKPKGRFGAHDHHLEDYGLTEDEVRARFAPYVARFNVPVAGHAEG